MPKICYDFDTRITDQTLSVIDVANNILEEYEAQGYTLTLRQLYYKFVARDLFPADRKWVVENGKWKRHPDGTINAEPNYDWLGQIMNTGRMLGLVDWYHMEDRTRFLKDLQHFENANDALEKLHGWYHIDFWEHQAVRPEVWIEKDALVGIVAPICKALDVPYFSCRGYTSQSEMWRAGQRLKAHHENGYDTHIIHFGDHDPSGIDMSRDIFDRMETFMGGTEFSRMALNMDQVKQYDPPPNPAKVTDSRCRAYIEKFGSLSWELDALEPDAITKLIKDKVLGLRDEKQWQKDVARRDEVQGRLHRLSAGWADVTKWMDKEAERKAKAEARKKAKAKKKK